MTLLRMIVREIQHAKLNTFLCLLAVTVSTALLVAMVAVSRASMDATRVLMKDMGFNLLVMPRGVDAARYQALDFQDVEMPEEYVSRLAKSTVLARHIVGKYQKTVPLNGRMIVLTGVLPEVTGRGEKEPMPTAYVVPPGHAFVGFAAARALGIQTGDRLEILGRPFVVDRVLPAVGMIPDDIRVYAHLRDVQALLARPGRINAIDALSCMCPTKEKDVVAALERSIHQVLPDVEVKPYESILLAREKQRNLIRLLGAVTLAVVVAAAALAIWGLTYLNVGNRHREIGVLRALGVPGWRIGALFLCKIVAYSLAGALLGCTVGYALAAHWHFVEAPVRAPSDLLIVLVPATPLVTALFGIGPIVACLLQEPVDLLRDE